MGLGLNSFVNFADWAFKALIGGGVLLVTQLLHRHSQRLDEIQNTIMPIQYDLRQLNEKVVEQKDALGSLRRDVRQDCLQPKRERSE